MKQKILKLIYALTFSRELAEEMYDKSMEIHAFFGTVKINDNIKGIKS